MSVRQAKTQISLGIRPVCSESSLFAQWVAKNPTFLRADSEDSDRPGRMPRPIWVRWAHSYLVDFVMSRLCYFYSLFNLLWQAGGAFHTKKFNYLWYKIQLQLSISTSENFITLSRIVVWAAMSVRFCTRPRQKLSHETKRRKTQAQPAALLIPPEQCNTTSPLNLL